jgi:hypothetical protein
METSAKEGWKYRRIVNELARRRIPRRRKIDTAQACVQRCVDAGCIREGAAGDVAQAGGIGSSQLPAAANACRPAIAHC